MGLYFDIFMKCNEVLSSLNWTAQESAIGAISLISYFINFKTYYNVDSGFGDFC